MKDAKFRLCSQYPDFPVVSKKYGHIVIRHALIFESGAVYDITDVFNIERVVIDWEETFKLSCYADKNVDSIKWFATDEVAAIRINESGKNWEYFLGEEEDLNTILSKEYRGEI